MAARTLLLRPWAVLRPLPAIIVLVCLTQRCGGIAGGAGSEPDLNHALTRALATRGLHTEPAEVFVLDRPSGLLGSQVDRPRAVVRARRQGEPADVYLVGSRLSPEGRLLELAGVYNISDTSAVDERKLTVSRGRAAWIIAGGGKTYSAHLADLRGEPPLSGRGWTRLARWQDRLTNLQNTGQLVGVGRRSFKLDPAASQVTLAFTDTALLIDADSRRIRIGTEPGTTIEGERFVREQPHHKAQPGNLVTWAVDRVRAMPWFGSDRMQLVKAVAFAGLDWIQRVVGTVTGDDGSKRIAQELGGPLDAPPVEYTDPETGWPPPPMEPILNPPLEGEGKWRMLEHDPFVRTNPGAPAPFVTSFLRTDRKRAFSQIFLTVWDPRQVKLHAMSGTQEPKSATGETGPGLIPRDPAVLSRLLAGLNGGFQATHGEWGMMADGVVYLPPKPYAATITLERDGSNGFGTWPRDVSVPARIVSYRQNMTPLVMDDTVNPYRRHWWGGVPPGWEDESRTVRSGICLTKEGFVAYLYGTSIDADHLIMAMQRARCSYGIHLDMNPGHTGLEFYRAGPPAELPPMDRELQPRWEAEGPIPGMDGWRFRGRRMIRYMGLMNFPRYIDRESRDFFYLTLRHILPGPNVPAPLAADSDEEGRWRVKGLPQHGWPYSIATTWLRPDPKRVETKVRLLKLDPKTVRVDNQRDSNQVVVTLRSPESLPAGEQSLWLTEGSLTMARSAPHSNARLLASGHPPDSASATRAVAALGITASSRMLVYAEVSTALRPGADFRMLGGLLERLGCKSRIFLQQPVGAALGGNRDLSGHPVPRNTEAVNLVRVQAPGAKRVFTDTPVVSPDIWAPLQARRVRYFRKPKARRDDETDKAPDEQTDDSRQHEEPPDSTAQSAHADETATTSKPQPAVPPARGPKAPKP